MFYFLLVQLVVKCGVYIISEIEMKNRSTYKKQLLLAECDGAAAQARVLAGF